jgi:hypothetical protein
MGKSLIKMGLFLGKHHKGNPMNYTIGQVAKINHLSNIMTIAIVNTLITMLIGMLFAMLNLSG